jgi:hypothetical protein
MDRARQLVNFQPARGYQWRTEETIKMEKEKLDNRGRLLLYACMHAHMYIHYKISINILYTE